MNMKKFSCVLTLCMVVVLLLAETAPVTNAASCNPSELRPCLPAFSSSAQPDGTCCAKVKEQQPCFCEYLKDPNLKQYANSPNTGKIASACGVSWPNC